MTPVRVVDAAGEVLGVIPTEEALQKSSAKVFPAGTPLVALYGATVGKTGILGIDAATNQAVCAIFALENAFTPKYISYWLRFQRSNLIELSSGDIGLALVFLLVGFLLVNAIDHAQSGKNPVFSLVLGKRDTTLDATN